jgi:DHA1 family bicyclomycin/chloramphenicol resistance-like MFS transporter
MKLDRITLVGMVAMTAVSTDLYLSGIPLIVAEFNATQADGQLTLGIFMIGISLGQLIYGPLSDYYGRKPVLYVGLIAYIVASLGCAMALSIQALWHERLWQTYTPPAKRLKSWLRWPLRWR